MEKHKHLEFLFNKYVHGQCTAAEIRYLLRYFEIRENEDNLKALIDQELNRTSELEIPNTSMIENAVREVHYSLIYRIKERNSYTIKKSKTIQWATVSLAASVIIFLTAGLYFYQDKPSQVMAGVHKNKNDVAPGGNKAVLTLADGTKIVLDNAKKGVLAAQAGVSIHKTNDGQIVYDIAPPANSSAPLVYNSIETPKGGQYQVNLPDGSKVWLNAASVLRYPAVFAKDERRVEVSGEAYFEVAKNKDLPFRVVSGNQTIEVLGTHFNVNSYQDEENRKTTLLEGSVKVSTESYSSVIKPGEQAQIKKDGDHPASIVNVNTEAIVAWKNGYFRFDDTDLLSLMRQLSRWYDVEIVYEGQVSNEVFVGQIERKASLSKVLKILELGGVHFRIEGKKLIVMP